MAQFVDAVFAHILTVLAGAESHQSTSDHTAGGASSAANGAPPTKAGAVVAAAFRKSSYSAAVVPACEKFGVALLRQCRLSQLTAGALGTTRGRKAGKAAAAAGEDYAYCACAAVAISQPLLWAELTDVAPLPTSRTAGTRRRTVLALSASGLAAVIDLSDVVQFVARIRLALAAMVAPVAAKADAAKQSLARNGSAPADSAVVEGLIVPRRLLASLTGRWPVTRRDTTGDAAPAGHPAASETVGSTRAGQRRPRQTAVAGEAADDRWGWITQHNLDDDVLDEKGDAARRVALRTFVDPAVAFLPGVAAMLCCLAAPSRADEGEAPTTRPATSAGGGANNIQYATASDDDTPCIVCESVGTPGRSAPLRRLWRCISCSARYHLACMFPPQRVVIEPYECHTCAVARLRTCREQAVLSGFTHAEGRTSPYLSPLVVSLRQ